MSDFQSRLCALQDKIDQLTEERDRYRDVLIDAERVLEWGEPKPKPVLQRVRAALLGGEERDDH